MPRIDGRLLYPHPDKPDVLVTRQRLYQLKMRAAGRCVTCGSEDMDTARYCHLHARQYRAYRRAVGQRRFGHQPWTPGGRGRPPIDQQGGD